MKELVEYIAKALVDNPDEVSVTEVATGPNVLIELRVGPGDMGRVIGRQGRVVNAMRSLVQLTASRHAKLGVHRSGVRILPARASHGCRRKTSFCSAGRIRTYNQLLNRELRYRCATAEYGLSIADVAIR